MFQHRELGLIQAYRTGATLIIAILFWGYFAISPQLVKTEFSGYFEYFLILVFGFQLSFLLSRNNDIFAIASGIFESHRFIWPHILFMMAISSVIMVVTRNAVISRFFLITYFIALYAVLLVFSRYFALGIFRFFVRHEAQPLLLVGKPEEVQNVRFLLEKAKIFGFTIVGLVTDAPAEDLPPGIRKVGNPEDLEKILGENRNGNVFILGSPGNRRVLGGWIQAAETHGCRVSLVNDLDVFLQRRLNYFRCDRIDLIEMHPEPLQNLVNRILKRCFDIVVSLPVVCFVLPPLMLFVWLIQRSQAPGPLFFQQNRSGLDNRPFPIFKFRTMYAKEFDASVQAKVGDSRIYPAGRWLRRFSLDEFPQFANVLLGHMSLIGPRPHMTQHDEIFAEKMSSYRIRGFVKPGISGLAQIRGFRGETATAEDVIRRVEYDIEYIETWTFGLDIYILCSTFLQLIKPPAKAY
jgi:undecaprenyl-phosphate glucose phosphotransferase